MTCVQSLPNILGGFFIFIILLLYLDSCFFMAEAAVVACLERTGKLLIWEGNFLSGVINQVHDVQLQMKKLQSFLKDADRKRGREDVFRWVREVREVALRMEDVLETYAVDVESRRQYGQLKLMITRCCDIFGECITLHKLDPEMKSIKKKLTNLAERKESLKLEESGESSNAEQDIQVLSEAKFEADFVGREVEIKKVVSHLRNKTQFLQVVSIWGMGGLGKTTLAGKVYKDVRSHFDASAWVSLTQNFDPLKVLRKILKDLLKEAGEIETMEIEKLQQKLREVLKEKNCLVVLDDIWHVDHWNKLELAFPPYGEEESGTKILLTTRKQQVAKLGFIYELKGLTPDEGWNLLSKKAFPTRDNHDCDPYAEDRVDPEKEKIGKEIVKKCQGLPLAISAIGGVLKGKRSVNDWRSVKRDISSSLISGEDSDEYGSVRRILARSYDDLTFRHKQLFLYLGNYEEDVEIYTDELYQRWIAEGMVSLGVKQAKGITLMNVAENYLNELAERSLVLVTPLPDNYGSWLKFDKCRLHDLMRDLCIIKRKEEDILNLTAIGDAHSESFDFQAVVGELSALANYVYDGSDTRVPLDKYEFGQLRSIAFAGRHELPQIVQNLQQFKLVRVLNLNYFEFEYGKLPQELSYLIHLRYLSLFECKLNELPQFIGDFRYLETLDLRVRDDNVMIPNVLRNLKRLKHLYLPEYFNGKLNFYGLNELEMLWNISGSKCEMDDLVKLGRLQVIGEVQVESPQQLEDALNVIASKQYTSLVVEHVDLMSSSEASNYLTQLLECSSLTELTIGSDVGRSFPKEINNHNFSQTLVGITLEGCKYEDDPMPFLEKLPNLITLALKTDSYLGEEIVCSAIGFPRLTTLALYELEYLETWSLEKGAMPNLAKLYIEDCVELEMLPDALEFLTSLGEIKIYGMSEVFNDRIRGTNGGEGQDFHKIRHVPSVLVNGTKNDR